MADLQTLCIDGNCMDIPSGGGGGGGSVDGVKGQQEGSYRTGNVNLTPDNIAYLGLNPIGSLTDDTYENWNALKVGYAYVNSAVTNGQPNSVGYIVNLTRGNSGSYLTQLFLSGAANARIYRRASHASGAMPAWQAIDDDTKYTAGTNVQISASNVISATDTKYTAGTNIAISSANAISIKTSPAFTGTPTAPTQSDKSESSTQIATNAFVQGAINRRIPKAIETGSASFSMATGTNKRTFNYTLFTAPASGTFIGLGWIQFAANSTGFRDFAIARYPNASTDSPTQAGAGMCIPATGSNEPTTINVAAVFRMSSGQVLKPMGRQNSGSTLACEVYLGGIFIKD